MKLPGKTALVTGAASGIGRATAQALARAGCRLVLCDISRAGLDALARELDPAPLFAEVVDVGDRAAMQAFAAAVHEEVPALDVVVNNAGIAVAGSLWETPLEAWDRVLRVNLEGVLHGCHFFAPKMVERAQGGQIVNVSSLFGFFGGGNVNAYCTSKFAVLGMSECLRAELRPHGIGVSTICPGMIRTAIVAEAPVFGVDDPGAAQARVRKTFANKGAPPEKVARAILKAIRKNKAVVPVAPEAWVLYWLKRLSPSFTAWLGRTLDERFGLE